MKVLVTGGAGYIGSHVVKYLVEKGEEVVIYDNFSTGHRSSIEGRGILVEGDLADIELLNTTMEEYQIDAVVHMAASCLVHESMENPSLYFRNNLVNGINLLDSMVKNNVKNFVFSSTCAIFGEPEELPIHEELAKNPINPYGESKLVFEKLLKWYEEIHQIYSVKLRYFNAAGADPTAELGEDHWPETHVIPLVIKTALGERESFSIFGTDFPTPDGTCIRDYIHVNDLAQAHWLALNFLQKEGVSRSYNLGDGIGYSVRELVDTVKKITKVDFTVIEEEARLGDPASLIADSNRIRSELGWRPEFSDLETIVETAWRWYQSHPDGYKD